MKETTKLLLNYKGEDDWSHSVYQDQFGRTWKDIGLHTADQPSLCSASGFDGEPIAPIKNEFEIISAAPDKNKSFEYQMLSRLQSDCEYYLGYGNRNSKHLTDNSEIAHINTMKERWTAFSETEKPTWLKWAQIMEYESKMVTQVCISFKELYLENGANLEHGGYIDFYSEDENHEYYDLQTSDPEMANSVLIACDGEKFAIINRNDDIITLQHIDSGKKIYLTKHEYDIAVFNK